MDKIPYNHDAETMTESTGISAKALEEFAKTLALRYFKYSKRSEIVESIEILMEKHPLMRRMVSVALAAVLNEFLAKTVGPIDMIKIEAMTKSGTALTDEEAMEQLLVKFTKIAKESGEELPIPLINMFKSSLRTDSAKSEEEETHDQGAVH